MKPGNGCCLEILFPADCQAAEYNEDYNSDWIIIDRLSELQERAKFRACSTNAV
jgi:hypothetical protein